MLQYWKEGLNPKLKIGQKILNVARERYRESIMTFREGETNFQRGAGPVIREDVARG